MLELLSRNIANLLSSDDDINEDFIIDATMSYRVTVSVECTWPGNKYWEPMLKNQSIKETDDWIAQLANVITPLLEETLCVTDNQEENDNACHMHSLLSFFLVNNNSS